MESAYLNIGHQILSKGRVKTDRTGTGTISSFGHTLKADLRGYKLPFLTTKEILYPSFFHETIWFISGSTDVKYLKDNGVSLWDDWVLPKTAIFNTVEKNSAQDRITALRCKFPQVWNLWKGYKAEHKIGRAKHQDIDAFYDQVSFSEAHNGLAGLKLMSGSIGEGAYGTQWRYWDDTRIMSWDDWAEMKETGNAPGYEFIQSLSAIHGHGGVLVQRQVDQLGNAIKLLRTNPDSRRIIVSAWNPGRLEDAALPPCHSFYQFFSSINPETGERELELLLLARSQDFPVGTPFNIAQYGLLAHMVAHVTGHKATTLTWVGGDTHIYQDQVELFKEQRMRPLIKDSTPAISLPEHVKEIDDFKFEDLQLTGYDKFHPRINYPVAV